MTNIEFMQSLYERIEHSDTMRKLSAAEDEWLSAAEQLVSSISIEEQRAWDAADYF